jgi:hypothetical protein
MGTCVLATTERYAMGTTAVFFGENDSGIAGDQRHLLGRSARYKEAGLPLPGPELERGACGCDGAGGRVLARHDVVVEESHPK